MKGKKSYGSKDYHIIVLVWSLFFITSCNITKMVPEGRYLVSNVEVKVDTKDINDSQMSSFIRQKPNDPKISLRVYNAYNGDTSRWIVKKMGAPPILYDSSQTDLSARNIRIEMANKGYLNAKVDTIINISGKKIDVTYNVTSNEPYRIRDYDISISDEWIDTVLSLRNIKKRSEIKEGDPFSMETLEKERASISQILRHIGYYTATEDNFRYLADTSLMSNQVDLQLILKDTIAPRMHYIRNIKVISGYDPFDEPPFKLVDSVEYKDLSILYDSTHFLRPSVLRRNILMEKGERYSDIRDKQSYNLVNSLGSISRTNVQYSTVNEGDSALLDYKIYLTEGNIHGIQTGIDGTNKAGNLGIAANISYNHYNLFNGAEHWNIKLRGAYEFVKKSTDEVLSENYYEFGIGTSLIFPQLHLPLFREYITNRYTTTSEYSINFDIQRRVDYTRNFFNLNWKERFSSPNGNVMQTYSIIDINYVMMPKISQKFDEYLKEPGNELTRFSYEDIFTAGINYSIVLSMPNQGKFGRRQSSFRFFAESSGNLLYWGSELFKATKSESGQYQVLNNPFAQFLKGDIDFAQTFRFDAKNTIAGHLGLGMAYPYNNSKIMPFEKRYFAGGPNNVRGWNTRHLGPGTVKDTSNLATQVGDINLIMSLEYRYKWIKYIELAAFVDAGNVWTVKEYENQPGGHFKFSSFYEQIAVGCGIGLRIDLGFIVIRFDGGKRLYDPAEAKSERFVLFDKFKGNAAFYFAIGYPF